MTDQRRSCDVLAVILDVGLMLENTAVFQSQVTDQLLALRSFGYQAGILAVSRDRAQFDRVAGLRLLDAGVQVFLVEDRGFWRNLLAMAASLRRIRRTHRIGVAYVRGIWGPVVLALEGSLRRLRYIYDVRGALADETRATGRARVKQGIYSTLERWSIRRASGVTAVTQALAEVVARTHVVGGIRVVPCCVNVDSVTVPWDAAQDRRQRLGYTDSDLVLVYSGGLSHYQQVPATIALWRRLRGEDGIKFLLLTNDAPHSAPTLVGDLSDFGSSLRHMSLSRDEVALTLAAADVGFMLRDTRELNRVASPVKFAEYLAAGLAVVASPGTGDASDLIEQHRVGALINPLELDSDEARVRMLLKEVRAEREMIRARAQGLAARRYDWQAYRATFRSLYGAPMNDSGARERLAASDPTNGL